MSYEERDGVLHEPPIHGWFGLTYAAYLVWPRALLEDMPHEWQEKMIALADEFNEVFNDSRSYMVKPKDDSTGRYIKDPLSDYRYADTAPFRVKTEETEDGG